MVEKTLYERLGGVFGIAAVVDRVIDAMIEDPVIGEGSDNPALRAWHVGRAGRTPGLKVMLTLWVCEVAGGPYHFKATRPGKTFLGLEEAHRPLEITPRDFDAFAGQLARSLDAFEIAEPEKGEIMTAFAAHRSEVVEGSMISASA